MQQGTSINLDINRVAATRRFCNKIWNAVKFVLSQCTTTHKIPETPISTSFAVRLVDRWIMDRLVHTVERCNHSFRNMDIAGATSALYNFFLYEFCDVYLEFTKPVFYKRYHLDDQTQLVHCHTFNYLLIIP
jgi:valyl-tRNA synthetase